MAGKVYVETFDLGPGGWFGWINNSQGPKPLEIFEGALVSRSPWWIDYNHAPPGAGYLHMVYCLLTKGPGIDEAYMEAGGRNRFVEEGFSTDFTNARLEVRLKGELEMRGAQLVLLVQGSANALTSGWALVGQPFRVTQDWTEQVVTLRPDPMLWRCLGSRHDRTKTYGRVDLPIVLHDVLNILLILFPLTIVPMGPLKGDPHLLRAGKDYPVWQGRLPEGYLMLDEVRIEPGEN